MGKTRYHCTANGDSEDCWLDENRRDLCWIENPPERKEDCKYWEIKENYIMRHAAITAIQCPICSTWHSTVKGDFEWNGYENGVIFRCKDCGKTVSMLINENNVNPMFGKLKNG